MDSRYDGLGFTGQVDFGRLYHRARDSRFHTTWMTLELSDSRGRFYEPTAGVGRDVKLAVRLRA